VAAFKGVGLLTVSSGKQSAVLFSLTVIETLVYTRIERRTNVIRVRLMPVPISSEANADE
jgi:hypothetical protein